MKPLCGPGAYTQGRMKADWHQKWLKAMKRVAKRKYGARLGRCVRRDGSQERFADAADSLGLFRRQAKTPPFRNRKSGVYQFSEASERAVSAASSAS